MQSKFESATLEAESELWPTPLNLHRWHIQTGVTCSLCQLPHPNSHNVSNGCPVALHQGRYTYH